MLLSRTRLIAVFSALIIVAVVAGCGSSSSSSTATSRSAPAPAAPSRSTEIGAIKTDWVQFFNGSTPTSKRVALLQNGPRYRPVIAAQSNSPLAKQSAAKVSDVKLTGPTTASVRYTILLGGKPALQNQTGTAVKSGGVWKVADASFCRLLGLQGTTPPACPKA